MKCPHCGKELFDEIKTGERRVPTIADEMKMRIIEAEHWPNMGEYFSIIGSKGGKKSKRTLTTKQARAMVKAREKKRAGGKCK